MSPMKGSTGDLRCELSGLSMFVCSISIDAVGHLHPPPPQRSRLVRLQQVVVGWWRAQVTLGRLEPSPGFMGSIRRTSAKKKHGLGFRARPFFLGTCALLL